MSREDFLKRLSIKNYNNFKRYTGKKLDFNKLKSNVKRKIAIGLMAAIVITGFTGCARSTNDGTTITTPSTSQSTTIDEYEHLNSSEAILNDFKERYVEAYNEKNGTNLRSSDIVFLSSAQDYIFKTYDGQYVTHGTNINETKTILNNYGDYSRVINDTVLQILNSDNNDVIETCRAKTGETVLSGSDLDNLSDLLNSSAGKEATTLGEDTFVELGNLVAEANSSYLSSDEIKKRVEEYKNLVKEIDNNKTQETTTIDEGFEK